MSAAPRRSGSRLQERHIAVTKTARYWTLGNPDTADEVWFVLHGYRQLANRFLRRFAALDDGHRLIVAPEGLSRFYIGQESGRHGASSIVGASWMTREDREREIRDYVAYLDGIHRELAPSDGGSDGAVTVLGFSQGVATASRWVTLGAVEPVRLVLWGDFTPPDLDLGRAAIALTDVDVVMVRGTEDPALESELGSEEAARLSAAGITYRTHTYAGGHDIQAGALETLVATGLDRPR